MSNRLKNFIKVTQHLFSSKCHDQTIPGDPPADYFSLPTCLIKKFHFICDIWRQSTLVPSIERLVTDCYRLDVTFKEKNNEEMNELDVNLALSSKDRLSFRNLKCI